MMSDFGNCHSQMRLLYTLDHMTSQDLTFTILWALSADDKLLIFSYFSQETGIDISYKLSPLETVCMKCQIPFFGINKKNTMYFKMFSVEIFTQHAKQ